MIVLIDPRRISERCFGGPYFSLFHKIEDQMVQCVKTGEVYDIAQLATAWRESRNLKPIEIRPLGFDQ